MKYFILIIFALIVLSGCTSIVSDTVDGFTGLFSGDDNNRGPAPAGDSLSWFVKGGAIFFFCGLIANIIFGMKNIGGQAMLGGAGAAAVGYSIEQYSWLIPIFSGIYFLGYCGWKLCHVKTKHGHKLKGFTRKPFVFKYKKKDKNENTT